GIFDRIVQSVAVAVERLGVGGSHRIQLLVIALIFAIQAVYKARLAKADGEWLERDAIHTTRDAARYDTIRADKAAQPWVVVAGIVVQQAGVVQGLAGEVALALGDAAIDDLAPWVEALGLQEGAAPDAGGADAAELVAIQEDRLAAADPLGDDL